MNEDQTSSSTNSGESLSSKEIQHIFSHEENKIAPDHSNDDKKSPRPKERDKDLVSIIYYQRKDSPKYFEIKKSIFFWWFVILPAVTLVSLTVAIFAAVHLSPTHLLQNYLSAKNYSSMKGEIESLKTENERLQDELKGKNRELLELKKSSPDENQGAETTDPALATTETPASTSQEAPNKPATEQMNPAQAATETVLPKNNAPLEPVQQDPTKKLSPQAFGLSYLSIFKPVAGQKDRTRPAQLSLSGFNVVSLRDTISLKFNITPLLPNEQKIAGHILVIMKGETGLQVYPQMSLNAPDAQISYSAGESFATQRFRPVDASFLKPRKSGQFVFTVLIFARNGDLIHSQTVPLFVRL